MQATPFIDLFQDYGRSHMWYGGQLLIMLVVALACGLQAGVVQLLSTIIAIVALMAAPFWFNPFTFCWNKNTVGSGSCSRQEVLVAVSPNTLSTMMLAVLCRPVRRVYRPVSFASYPALRQLC